MKRLLKNILRRDRGQAVVEFAVMLPVVLILLLGMIEWGFLLWTKTTMENAVREGARHAVVIRDWDDNPTASESEIKDLVEARLGSLPAVLTDGVRDHIQIQVDRTGSAIDSITVSVVGQPYNAIIGFTDVAVPDTLSAVSQFRYEGTL